MPLPTAGPVAEPLFPPLVGPASPITEVIGSPTPSGLSCANCLAPLGGKFCAECGAPRLEDRPLTVRRFAGDLWTELTSVDSATVRTARTLLLEPGRLTREYLDGRTRWYLSPLRLFLLAASLSVFVGAVSGYQQRTLDMMRNRATAGPAARHAASPAAVQPKAVTPTAAAAPAAPKKPLTARQLRRKAVIDGFKPDGMMSRVMDNVSAIFTSPWLQVGYPLAVALALGIVLRRKRRNYAEHFVHALHFMAFSSLLTAALIPFRLMRPVDESFFSLVTLLYWLVAGRYFYLSVRRIYADSVPRSVGDTALFAVTAQASMLVLPFVVVLSSIIWMLGSLVVRVLLA